LICRIAAFEAISGVPAEILYERMKTAVVGEEPDGAAMLARPLQRVPREPAGP